MNIQYSREHLRRAAHLKSQNNQNRNSESQEPAKNLDNRNTKRTLNSFSRVMNIEIDNKIRLRVDFQEVNLKEMIEYHQAMTASGNLPTNKWQHNQGKK